VGSIRQRFFSALHMLFDHNCKCETFHVDLLQHMEKNTKLDVQFINDSCQQYEKEYRHRVASIDKSMMDLRRMESRRDKNVWELKVGSRLDLQVFASESQQAAEVEEKRRYRFLAEKHQLLSNTLLQFYNKAQTVILNKAPLWKEELEASHNPVQNVLNTPASQRCPSGRLTPTHLENVREKSKEDRLRTVLPQVVHLMCIMEFGSLLEKQCKFMKSFGLSYVTGFASPGLSRSNSFGEQAAQRAEAGNKEGNSSHLLKVQAVVPHVRGSNQTLLPFGIGDVVTVLLPEAQNGWLYGKLEGTSIGFPLRSSRSVDNLLGQSTASVPDNYWQKSSRPHSPVSSPSSMGAGTLPNSISNSATSNTTLSSVPMIELFHFIHFHPFRGTNPFATVKLRPTVTNDRSAPII
uniref:IMD domain-containing protein n=1 Tax=Laticauda laticaudata TaxID=8630 RepID=A0A8C5RV19_LATLA